MIEGSLEAKLPTIWTDGKAQPERSPDKAKVRREKIRDEAELRRRMSGERRCGAPKGKKVAKHHVFPMICGIGGSKSRLATAAGAIPSNTYTYRGHVQRSSIHQYVSVRFYLRIIISAYHCLQHLSW